MLTADSADRINTHKVAFITGASIFIMGFLNGLALDTYGLSVMISAQSGNVVWMGLNAGGGYWAGFLDNLGLFFGFAGGAAFALFTQSLFKHKPKQFFYNWTIFVLPIILYPFVLQYVVPTFVALVVLGFVSGAALGFFRKMYHLEINNAMATGSARFVGLHLAGALVKRNRQEFASLMVFFSCIFLFAAGAFLYVVLARVDFGLADAGRTLGLGNVTYGRLSLGLGEFSGQHGVDVRRLAPSNVARIFGLIVICIIPYFFCPKSAAVEQK
jgi:uncharacterized membrane protein YoaK (UPF0700 family)